jgi:hypothetical protein
MGRDTLNHVAQLDELTNGYMQANPAKWQSSLQCENCSLLVWMWPLIANLRADNAGLSGVWLAV